MKKTEQHLDPDEDIDLELFDINTLIDMIVNNVINDSKTIASILTYYHKYCFK